MHAVASTQVTEMTILEIGTHNNQFRRPFETHLDGNGLIMFKDKLQGAGAYAPAMLNGIANQFIMPSSQPETQLFIPEGWGTQRYRFHAKVRHNFRMGGWITEHISGYTNFPGIGHNGGFAPDMEFYVNSTLMVRESQEMTPMGIMPMFNVADNSHILVDNNWGGIGNGMNEQRMRPEDVFAAMSRTHLPAGTTVIDGRSTMSNVAVKSARSNNLAPVFMANVLENYRNAKESEEFGQGEQQILSQARGYAADNQVGKDPFLAAISQIRGTPLGNTFRWGDLERLDPNTTHVTTFIQMGIAEKAETHWAGQTADWGSADPTTLASTILSQSVPSLMMDMDLTELVFKVTNNVMGSGLAFVPFHARSFTSLPVQPIVDQFEIRLKHEILMDLTYNNQIAFDLEMKMDLYGESWIKISLNNAPFTDYCVPSFADALTVPVVTNQAQNALTIAEDFDSLLSALHIDCSGTETSGTIFGSI
jgi:hypothetical protein